MPETNRNAGLGIENRHGNVRLETDRITRPDLSFYTEERGNVIELNAEQDHRDVRIHLEGHRKGAITIGLTGGVRKQPYDDPYEGPYAVTSAVDLMQIYPTEDRVMTENLVVLPIPYFETSNVQGGLTVFIGGD